MTATILPLRRKLSRAWRIIEIYPGKWRGELHERDRGITRHTELGSLRLVRDAVAQHRAGLPVREFPLGPQTGPQAA